LLDKILRHCGYISLGFMELASSEIGRLDRKVEAFHDLLDRIIEKHPELEEEINAQRDELCEGE
jgi:hypothetical protein